MAKPVTTISHEFPPPPILTLDKCTIRPMHVLDAQAMSYHGSGPTISRFMTLSFPSPYTLKAAYGWIGFNLSQDTQYNYVICLPGDPSPDTVPAPNTPGSVIGGIGLERGTNIWTHTMEIGYWLGEDQAGKGIMTAAHMAITDWAFEAFPDVLKLIAQVNAGNTASLRIVEKAGYIREAVLRWQTCKNGDVSDVHVYRLCRDEWEELKAKRNA